MAKHRRRPRPKIDIKNRSRASFLVYRYFTDEQLLNLPTLMESHGMLKIL